MCGWVLMQSSYPKRYFLKCSCCLSQVIGLHVTFTFFLIILWNSLLVKMYHCYKQRSKNRMWMTCLATEGAYGLEPGPAPVLENGHWKTGQECLSLSLFLTSPCWLDWTPCRLWPEQEDQCWPQGRYSKPERQPQPNRGCGGGSN